jgi:ribosomal protein S18 acetylase RimI-like enzyme
VQFRPASAEDVDSAVPLIYSSGPATFDYVFADGTPGRAQAFLRQAFVDRDGEFSHRTHCVGVQDGQVVAVGAVFDSDAVLRFTVAAARQILRSYGVLAGAGVVFRGLRVERIIRPPRAGEYYVCHLGVREGLRSRGIGAALLEHLLRMARADRHQRATLDVAVGNPRAQALYERTGFRVNALRPSGLRRRMASVPGHRRMSIALPR